MANLRINKLDEALLNKIKTSIKESDGNNWKKEWTCRSLPINGISGRPFTGKTELFLFLVNQNLAAKGINGNRWFTYGQVNHEHLWRHPTYQYSFKNKDGTFTCFKFKEKVVDENGIEHSKWFIKSNIKEKDLKGTKWDEVLINETKKGCETDLINKGFKKEIIPTPVLAYAESPFFVIHYEDPVTHQIETFEFENKEHNLIFASEIKRATNVLKSKGVDASTITVRVAGAKLTPIYHESQLSPKGLERIKTPVVGFNKDLENLEINDLLDIARAMKLKGFITDDIKSTGNAFYNPKDDIVYVPSTTSFKDKESFYATAFHEITHATGHESRLNRNLNNAFGTPEYAKEELVAELGSIFLCNEYGVNSTKQLENNAEYLKNWLNSFENDSEKQDRAILKAIAQAGKSFDYINLSLDKELVKDTVIITKDELNDEAIKLDEIQSNGTALLKEINKKEKSINDDFELELNR